MGQESSMELTRITKLLLWLLSKRPDIGDLNVRDPEPEPTDWEQVLDFEELYADLTPQEKLALQVDYLNDCITKSIDDQTA
jgi:hypothetical protein